MCAVAASAGGCRPPAPPAQGAANRDALDFLALATKGSASAEFELADAGKKAVYMLRWVGAGGVVGPWSEAVTGTVAA